MFVPVIRVFLFHSLRFLLTVFLLASPWLTANRGFGQESPPQTEEQRQARGALNKGVQDLKKAQYEEATRDFLRAKQMDPKYLNERLYLATTYVSPHIPGTRGEENIPVGHAT